MTVSEFLALADKFEARMQEGFAPPWVTAHAPELEALNREIIEDVTEYRADLAADEKAGRKPRSCFPAHGNLTLADFVAAFQKLPPSERAMNARDALFRYLDKRYRCT